MKTLIVLEYVNYKFNIIKIIFNKFTFFSKFKKDFLLLIF